MASRNLLYSGKCIVSLTRGFREVVSRLPSGRGSKITFLGTAAVCLPFIELLAYAVRDLVSEMVYVPNTMLDKAVKLRYVEDYGFQVSEKADPRRSDAVVLLGGLAMPTSRITAEDVLNAVKEITKEGA